MFCSQLAIGWTNDYLDRGADRRYQREKPVPAGRLDERLLPPLIVVVLLASLMIGVALGALPLLFLIIGTSCGLAYDIGLKRTRWSWAPYLVAFAVLPPFVWSGMDVYRDELLVLYAAGAPIVPAIHLANALPDVEPDAATGARGSAVRLGRQESIRVMAGLLALPGVALAVSSAFVAYEAEVLGITLAAYVVLLAGGALSYARRRDEAAFRFVALAGVVFTTGLLSAL
jgi:4-hydroxybenzoate polyprenyltransferase